MKVEQILQGTYGTETTTIYLSEFHYLNGQDDFVPLKEDKSKIAIGMNQDTCKMYVR